MQNACHGPESNLDRWHSSQKKTKFVHNILNNHDDRRRFFIILNFMTSIQFIIRLEKHETFIVYLVAWKFVLSSVGPEAQSLQFHYLHITAGLSPVRRTCSRVQGICGELFNPSSVDCRALRTYSR